MKKICFLFLPLLAAACQQPMPPQPVPAPTSPGFVTPAPQPAVRPAATPKPVVVSNVPKKTLPQKAPGLRARTDLSFNGGGSASGPAVIDLR